MFKKFIDGLVFGTGFGIALTFIWIVTVYWVLPIVIEQQSLNMELGSHDSHTTNSAPEIKDNDSSRFLGTTGIHSGDFEKEGILSGGNGEIVGTVLANGKPVDGLKLRLALNGSVYSQWAITDTSGKYNISVPTGNYRIDGYTLDYSSANKVLAGKIDTRNVSFRSEEFKVSSSNKGQGLNLKFVDPVIKKVGQNEFSLKDRITLHWNEYPEAKKYELEISEKKNFDSWESKYLFGWSDKPKVTSNQFEIDPEKITLKPGYFYSYQVWALDNEGKILSRSGMRMEGYDFKVLNE